MSEKASKTKQASKFKGYDNILAVRLRQLMKGKGTTQQELAEKTGCSRQAIAQYMDGSNAPNIDKLILIAEFFNVSIDYLVGKDKRHTEEELVQNIVNYTSFSTASIEELKTEKLIAENNTKEYSNYFKITNSFIQSRIFLDITLCVTKLENSLKEKNTLLNMQKKSFTETNIDCEIFDDKGFENRLEEVEDKIGFCFYRIQTLITEFARDYCSKFIDEITINKNELVQIIRESIIEAARNNNSVPQSDTVEGILKDGESNGNNP